MARLAMMREVLEVEVAEVGEEVGRTVPWPMSWRVGVCVGLDVSSSMSDDAASLLSEASDVLRLKKSTGTAPQVRGAMKLATAVRPGCKYRSNL